MSTTNHLFTKNRKKMSYCNNSNDGVVFSIAKNKNDNAFKRVEEPFIASVFSRNLNNNNTNNIMLADHPILGMIGNLLKTTTAATTTTTMTISPQLFQMFQVLQEQYITELIYHKNQNNILQLHHEQGSASIADRNNNSQKLAATLNVVGTTLFQQHQYDYALICFLEELRIEDEEEEEANMEEKEQRDLDWVVNLSVTCNNIGRIFQQKRQFTEAIHYYKRSIKICSTFIENGSSNYLHQQANLSSDANISILRRLCAGVWYNLGLIYDDDDQQQKQQNNQRIIIGRNKLDAINAFQMSLKYRCLSLGPYHPDVACLLFNICILQMEQYQNNNQELNHKNNYMLSEATQSMINFLHIQKLCLQSNNNNNINNNRGTTTINNQHSTNHQSSCTNTTIVQDEQVITSLHKLSCMHKANGNVSTAIYFLNETLFIIQKEQQHYIDATTIAQHQYINKIMVRMGITLREIAHLYHEQGQINMALTTIQESVTLLKKSILVNENDTTTTTTTSTEQQQQKQHQQQQQQQQQQKELIVSLQLLGSLLYEDGQPVLARTIFRDTIKVIDGDTTNTNNEDSIITATTAIATSNNNSADNQHHDYHVSHHHRRRQLLLQQREICFMLAVTTCAPIA